MIKEDNQSAYKKRKAKGQVPLTLWFDHKMLALINLAAKTVNEPKTTWCERAIVAAVNRWSPPDNESLWPPCDSCGKRHDPQSHWPEGERDYSKY